MKEGDRRSGTWRAWREGAIPRTVILEAAITAFAADGYTGRSLNSVARDIGISRQLLLHYFPSKRALLDAVLEEADARLSPPRLAPTPLSLDTLLREVGLFLSAPEDEPELRRLTFRLTVEATAPDHPAHVSMMRWQRRRLTAIESLYEGAKKRGEIAANTDTAALAALTLGAFEGIERRWLEDPGPNRRDAISGLRQLIVALARTGTMT